MFNLLSLFGNLQSDTPFTSYTSLENIKLPELLRLCMGEVQTTEFCTFLQRPTDAKTIIDRQDFFKEFLSSEHLVDLFGKARDELLQTQQLAEQYEKEKDPIIKLFLFYRVVEVYLTLLEELVNNIVDAKSNILSGFAAEIAAFCQEEAVKNAVRDAKTIRRLLMNAISAYNFNIRHYGKNMLGYNSTPANDTSSYLDGRLLELFLDFGMDAAPLPKPRGIDGDMLYSYIWLLAKNDKQIYGRISDFYGQYQDIYNRIIPVNPGDISMALYVNTLFGYLNKHKIPLCYPQISPSRGVNIQDCHDLSLLVQKTEKIVPNDLICSENERIFILTGVNSGGKTTYLRGLGIAITLFAAGLFIPATAARIPFYNEMTALFAGGKAKGINRFLAEKKAVYDAVENAKPTSLLLINELFSSTDEKTALAEYGQMIKLLQQQTCFCLMITHFHNLTKWVQPYSDIACLMAATNERNERLYKIIRSRERYSNVMEILEKYSLTYSNAAQRGKENG
ncbi:MAG: hypothetical protein FWC32_03930 [Firmicutes bacterium]|nr:hypothetical protein [Bacillota bacterium]